MKPLHVGLLVFGAALAGGLAVRMSQAPPIQVSASTAVPARARIVPSSQPISAPPAVSDSAVTAVTEDAPPAVTSAPPPVYEEPAPVAPAAPKRKPFAEVLTPARPAEHPAPVAVAKVQPMAIGPAPYHEPAPSPKPAEPEPTPTSEPPPVAVVAPEPEPPAPVRKVNLNQGTAVAVRLNQSLSTDHVAAGDSFEAALSAPLVADGLIVAERGARVTGRVVAFRRAGRLGGTSEIELALSTVQTADGQRVAISTEPWTKRGDSALGRDAEKIGGGAALGAIIGAIAGGGVGAAIGAGAGGVAGAGASVVTGGKALNLPSETVLRFRIASRVTITERPL